MQTKNLKKKGFTLVELVVVVAVIAVLSAILIPTIGCFVEQAKETNDMATVRLLNTALVEDEAANGTPATMTQALAAMDRKGYDIEKLNLRSTGEIYWDGANNRFMLLKGDEVLYGDNTTPESERYNWWKLLKNGDELSTTYSNYLKEGYEVSGGALTISTGLDVGENTGITAVTYANDGTAKNIVIRTNGGELTVNAPADTVTHYGKSGKVVITAVARASYHEKGEVASISIVKGHVSVEKMASVSTIKVDTSVENDVKITLNSKVKSIIAKSGVLTADSSIDKAETKYEIDSNSTVDVENAVALVDGTLYEGENGFISALSEAKNGKTLILLKDVVLNQNFEINDNANLTIDLAGSKIALADKKSFFISGDSNFEIIGEGKVYEQSPYFGPVLVKNKNMDNGATFTLGENVELEGWAALFVDQYSVNSTKKYNFTANINGVLNGTNDTSGTVGAGIYVNGSNTYTGAECIKINLNSTAIVKGTGHGIYGAGYSKITMNEGSYVEGGITGIEMRAGELTVNGGTILGKGIPTTSTPNGNGATSTGTGIAIAQHTTKLETKVEIKGGKVIGFTAIAQENPQKNSADDTAKVSVKISGGTFEIYQKGKILAYFENYNVVTNNGMNISDEVFGAEYKLQKNNTNAYRVVPVSTQEDTTTSWMDVQ